MPIEDASPEDDIITISRKAGIVDENTGRPLYLLLERAKNAGCRIVVADALDMMSPTSPASSLQPWR